MKNQLVFGILALVVLSIAALVGVTYAYRGDGAQGPNYNSAVHEQLETALEAGDYDAWLKIRQENNLPMRGKIFQVVNKDNFDMYVQLHKANLEGDKEQADAIRIELGLGTGPGRRSGSCNWLE